MLLALCFALLLFAGGCVAPSFVFNPEKAERYLATSRDVDPDIADALLLGQPVKGMTKKEVLICLGTPKDKTIRSEGGLQTETWLYTRDSHISGKLRGSPLWNMDIPLARVVFGPDETMVSWRKYSGKEEAPDSDLDGKDVKSADTAIRSGKVSTPTRTDTQKRAPGKPFDEDNFKGWPRLTVNGTSSGVKDPSAVINNTAVSAGDTVAGVEVIAVDPQGVTLRYAGSVQFLPLGKSTN